MHEDQAITENKTKRERKYTIATILLIVMASISGLVTIGSMVYFRMQVRDEILRSDSEPREYSRHYALVTRDNSDPFWAAVYSSMKEEGENTDVYVDKLGDHLAADYSKNERMEIAIASKCDGIIFEADDSNESVVLINKATAAGIPVITVRSDSAVSARRSFVGVSYYNLGTEYGRLILNASREAELRHTEETPVSVIVLTDESIQDTSQNIVITAIRETIQKKQDSYPEIILTTASIDNSGEFTAEESIRDVLQNSIMPDIIVCLNEVNTVSVYQTMVEQNKVGESIILGYYDSEAIIKAIEKKVIYATITVDTQQLGRDCVDALNEYIEYKRVSEYYGVDYKIINQDNVAGYQEGGQNGE